MKAHDISSQTLAVCLLFLFCLPATAFADPLDDGEDLPATVGEIRFINSVVEQVKVAVPPIDGWEQTLRITAGGNTVKDGKEVMIFERARNYPLLISIRLDFKRITAADRQAAVEQKSAQELQQELMAAAMSGDTQKSEQLQQQLAALMQSQMEAGAMGQAAGVSPMQEAEKPTEFYVQVIVNGDGETIGKEYGIDTPGVAKAFRVDKGDKDLLTYKYYMGAWTFSERVAKNWSIVAPAADQNATNHLRALVLFADLFGDRDSVETYVGNHLDLDSLNDVVN